MFVWLLGYWIPAVLFQIFFVQDVNIVNKSDQSETTIFMGVTLFWLLVRHYFLAKRVLLVLILVKKLVKFRIKLFHKYKKSQTYRLPRSFQPWMFQIVLRSPLRVFNWTLLSSFSLVNMFKKYYLNCLGFAEDRTWFLDILLTPSFVLQCYCKINPVRLFKPLH